MLDSGGHLFVGRQREATGAIATFLAGVAAADGKVRPLRPAAGG